MQQLREQKSGGFRLADGEFLTSEQLREINTTDPALMAQLQQAMSQRDIELQNQHTSVLNDLNLTEYQTQVNAESAANSRANQGFQNELDRYQASIQFDNLNLDRAVADVNRSRLRARRIPPAYRPGCRYGHADRTVRDDWRQD